MGLCLAREDWASKCLKNKMILFSVPVAEFGLSAGASDLENVSASLQEQQREELKGYGFDGWILKPIDFQRTDAIFRGITDLQRREANLYWKGCNWEAGGWLVPSPMSHSRKRSRGSKSSSASTSPLHEGKRLL